MAYTHFEDGVTICKRDQSQAADKARWRVLGGMWIVSAVLALCSATATAAGWYTGEIATIQLNRSGNIFVWVSASSNHECGSARLDYVLSNESTGKSILAALLSWQAQGRSAMFYIENCSGTAGIFSDVRNAN